MGNDPIGLDFIEGSLGVISLTFDGTELGTSMDEANLEKIEDITDIFHAQFGTQPADKIITGQAYQLTVMLDDITAARLAKLIQGLTISSGGHSVAFGTDLYRSAYQNFAKELKAARVDSDGVASTNQKYIMTFYKAYPTVNGSLGPFGPSTQRSIEVVFYIFKELVTKKFGFYGYASSLGL